MKRILTGLLFVWGSFVSVYGQQVHTGPHVKLEGSQSNVYVAGGNVNVTGEVAGDLIGAGGEVVIDGQVKKDILLAGGQVTLNGASQEDVRIIGGEIRITRDIAGDLNVTGGEVRIEEGVHIGGSLLVAGGEVRCYGTIAGDVYLAGGDVQLYGEVGGNLDVRSGNLYLNSRVNGQAKIITDKLSLGDEAWVGGAVSYWQRKGKVDWANHLAEGNEAKFDDSLKPRYAKVNWQAQVKTAAQVWMAYRLVAGLLLTLLLGVMFPRYFERKTGVMQNQPGRSFARGMFVFLGLPIVSGLAMVTIIGIPVGLVGISAFTIAATLANAATAVLGAYEWERWSKSNWSQGRLVIASLGVFMGLRMVSFVPVIGTLATFILAAITIGHLLRRTEPPVVTATEPADSSDLV
ncbi:MAG: hypothetical protein H6555_02990 [Lewinellaceae bacterium]|nr:hypothetical protein [Lewinellaceae bacterium]